MDTARLLSELRLHGETLHRSAAYVGLNAPVPSCPGWTVANLIGHLSKVHGWANWIVRGGDRAQFDYVRPPESELLATYQAVLEQLLATLVRAPDSLSVWTSVPAGSAGSAKRFWIRRMAHETAIHRVDLQLASGYGVDGFDPDFAADGVRELLVSLIGGGAGGGVPDGSRTVALTPLDSNDSWTVSFGPDGVRARAGDSEDAELSVFAMASDLYRWVWNRAGDDEVSLRGDFSLADRWRSELSITARRS